MPSTVMCLMSRPYACRPAADYRKLFCAGKTVSRQSEATIDTTLTCEAWDGLLTKDLLVFGTGRSKLGVSAIEESFKISLQSGMSHQWRP